MPKLKPSPVAPWAEDFRKKFERIDARAAYLARRDVWEAERVAARSEGQFRWREEQEGLTRRD